jgi:HEAT repeat protein
LPESHAYTAIEALGRLGTATARDAVAGRANDPSPQVRKFVVEALARIADAPAQAVLEKMARGDTEEWIRDLADRRMKSERRRQP